MPEVKPSVRTRKDSIEQERRVCSQSTQIFGQPDISSDIEVSVLKIFPTKKMRVEVKGGSSSSAFNGGYRPPISVG